MFSQKHSKQYTVHSKQNVVQMLEDSRLDQLSFWSTSLRSELPQKF